MIRLRPGGQDESRAGRAAEELPIDEAVALLVAAAGEHERSGRMALAQSHLAHAQELARERNAGGRGAPASATRD